jgi:hypothetical protein
VKAIMILEILFRIRGDIGFANWYLKHIWEWLLKQQKKPIYVWCFSVMESNK